MTDVAPSPTSKSKTDNAINHFEDIQEITQKHQQEFQAIRALLTEGQEPDDVVVYRYLRGYKFSVEKAAAALNKTLVFRKTYNTAAIREKASKMNQEQFPFAEQLMKSHPHNIQHCYDKSGQPVSLERIGHTNPAMLTKLLSLENLMLYHLYHMENKAWLVAELSRKTGKVVRTCKIMDLDGLSVTSLHRVGLGYLKAIIAVSQDNYPEMLGNLYVINAPWVFRTAWGIVKPWLQPATLEKIQILGADYETVLRANIDVDKLPSWAGGECKSCPNGCVVEFDPNHGMKETLIAAKGSLVETVEIKEGGSIASWEFRTEAHDIGYSVLFVPAATPDKPIKVQEYQRVDCHKTTVYGGFTVPEPGTLNITFDNSYSRWTSKKLIFKIAEVEKSDEPDMPAEDAQAQ